MKQKTTKKSKERRKQQQQATHKTVGLFFSLVFRLFSMALHEKWFYSLLPSDCPHTFKYWQVLNICRSKALFSIIFHFYVQWLYIKVTEKKQLKPIATRQLLALQENPVSLNLTGDCCTLYELFILVLLPVSSPDSCRPSVSYLQMRNIAIIAALINIIWILIDVNFEKTL